MANKLHRSGGFIFNNVVVDNTNNIFLLDVVKNATPIKTRYDFIVPKRNGSETYDNRYEDNYIDVVIGIYDVNIQTRRAKQKRLLELMIESEGKLYFLDEPILFYQAEIINTIEVAETEVFTELTIHFKASYCKYTDEKIITLNTGANNVYNMGNYRAENITEIIALTTCESIVIGNGVNSFTLQNLIAGEVIYVDSAKMIVYKIIDNVKNSVLTRFRGQFWQVAKGKSIVTLSGTNYNATVNLIFKDTYII